MKIKSATFVISNQDVAKCPKEPLSEYAFIGRSNVGKSSLINMLTGRKNLAKTSGTPGKTQLINHFKINDNWFLVDLPGYGYAKVSKSKRNIFQKLITQYFEKRRQLVSAFVLIDIRHKPQRIDLEFLRWMGENAIPFAIVFTKADKLKPEQIPEKIEAYKKGMMDDVWEEVPHYFATSAKTYQGKEELLDYIDSLNAEIRSLSKR